LSWRLQIWKMIIYTVLVYCKMTLFCVSYTCKSNASIGILFLYTSFSEQREAGISHTWIWVYIVKPETHAAFRENRQSHSQKRELCFFLFIFFIFYGLTKQEELSYNVLFTFPTLLLGTDITTHFVCGSYLTCSVSYNALHHLCFSL